MSAPDPPIPAATVIIMRDRSGAAPELLMVERARAMAFAGGALVFPGGRTDPGDVAMAGLIGGDVDDLAGRIAAIRETIEEAGVGIGLAGDGHELDAMRQALRDGEPFAELLQAAGIELDLEALVPFARWLPNFREHAARVFDTRFYLARAAARLAAPTPDGAENVRSFWASAQEVLDAADAGQASIIFPTRRNLERLATFACYDEAAASARAHPVRTITPWIEARDGAEHLCIPDDLGYPVTSQRLAAALRG